MRILIAGLSGAGKTTLALQLGIKLSEHFSCKYVNADDVRTETNNWDFSIEGRLKQAKEMITRSDDTDCDIVIIDTIAPTKEIREDYNADYSIWVDTVRGSQYSDTDELFVPFEDASYKITHHSSQHIDQLVDEIICHFFGF